MRTKNIKLILATLALMIMSACDSTYNEDWTDNTTELCQFAWQFYYLNSDAQDCHQQLVFNDTGGGMMTLVISSQDTTRTSLTWAWGTDGYFDKINISYANGNSDYMTNVSFGTRTLECTLNGTNVTYQGIALKDSI